MARTATSSSVGSRRSTSDEEPSPQQQALEWKTTLAQNRPKDVIEKIEKAIDRVIRRITRDAHNQTSSLSRVTKDVNAVTAATSSTRQNRILARINNNLGYCNKHQARTGANVAYQKILPLFVCCLKVALGDEDASHASLIGMEFYDASFNHKINSVNQTQKQKYLSTLLALKEQADSKVESFAKELDRLEDMKRTLAENAGRAEYGDEAAGDTTDMGEETDYSFDDTFMNVVNPTVDSNEAKSTRNKTHSAIEPHTGAIQGSYPTPVTSSPAAVPIAPPSDDRVIQMVDLEIFAGSIDAQTWEIFKMQGDLELICQHIYNELYETIGENVEKINQEWPPKLQLTSRLVNEALADPSTANYKRARKLRSQVSRTSNWVGQCLANIMSNVAYNKMPHEVFKTLDLVLHGDGVRMTGADGVVTLYKNFDINDPKFAIHVERAQRRHNMVKQAVDRASNAVAALIVLYDDTKPMLDKWKWEIPPAGSFKQLNVPAAGPSSSRR